MNRLGARFGLAARLARRELRGGLAGFRIFLLCLALGVAAIAGVGMVRSAIEAGLRDQGVALLGGDAQMNFTYRFASADEKAWMAGKAVHVSEIVDFRSMAVAGQRDMEDHALTQVKAVDDLYPLSGTVALDHGTLAEALASKNGVPGAVMEAMLADRLNLKPGDTFKMGLQTFRLRAVLLREPDSATAGFSLGPRTIVRTADLAQSGLIAPGTLYETDYRLSLPVATNLGQLKAQAEKLFRDKGMRWSDSRHASPGIERFVDRIGSFLILVGLAGLAVGGVGVASAVRAYLQAKTQTIATLKVLGAESGLVFRIYLIQIAALAGLGVALGLILGTIAPLLAAPLISASLPFPTEFSLYPAPLIEAAFYGVTTALLFTLWPLAQAERQRAAALYRGSDSRVWPRWLPMLAMLVLLGLLVGAAMLFSGTVGLALGALGGCRSVDGAGTGRAWPALAGAARGAGPLVTGSYRLAAGVGRDWRATDRGDADHPVAWAWPIGAGSGGADRQQPAQRHHPRPARQGPVVLFHRHTG